ncbi:MULTISPECIES: AbrB family transcriptional regulator [Methylobacterium]|uniref:AbrB family transcriptional regulator n=4 Tax=Pseudomonadota TaxID=1224 RepID=A0ABQ4T0I3_9HYPH|nr:MULTISPECIES: AbrB family transcriptional regulator [Methylobacterium]PIU07159.1 MAG: AbrB family transcriptional regulator [Methylobacterium sp. CG09_land_8_20_14_0_10_71_15]PIU15622.1 MAG: AbrB family transcriptional regulator [Methylobacterium sp. CG08_land_8_20_14_0_20_71_15]GBU18909.1 regulator of aidB expression [Methylobacterium sp.]GJE08290.1 hypothetical protein AOPFMNJM_3626 [Methylobacterium jeotgali]
MPDAKTIRLWAALLAASGALTYALVLARFPAASLLGAMLCAIAFGAGGAGLTVHRVAFLAAQAVIGCLVAHAVTGETARTLLADGPVMLLVVLLTVAAGALVGLVLTRLRVLPGTTAAWGSSPGGAAAMVAMAEDYGSDPRLVAFMQYVRVVAVVLSAALVTRFLTDASAAPASPAGEGGGAGSVLVTLAVALFGGLAGHRLRIPAGAQIGPMVIGSILHVSGLARMDLPDVLLEGSYALIGWYIGLRFTRETVRETLHALPGILAATFGVIVLCGFWALALTRILPIDPLTAFLATSPGGLDSVAIIAVGSTADVSFVLAVQTLRLFVVLITGPILARWIARAAPGGR